MAEIRLTTGFLPSTVAPEKWMVGRQVSFLLEPFAYFQGHVMLVFNQWSWGKVWKKNTKQRTGVIGHYLFGGIKQCKYMVVLSDFPYTSALFGLVMFHDPWKDHHVPSWEWVHIPTKPGFSRIFILQKMPSGDMDSFPGYLWRTVRSHNSKCVDDFWKVRQNNEDSYTVPMTDPWDWHIYLYMKTIKINHSWR